MNRDCGATGLRKHWAKLHHETVDRSYRRGYRDAARQSVQHWPYGAWSHMSRTVLLGVCALLGLLEILLCLMLVAPAFVDTGALGRAVYDLAATNSTANQARYTHAIADAQREAVRSRSEAGAVAVANGLLIAVLGKRLRKGGEARPHRPAEPLEAGT
jgi:hypothetical protein